MIFSGSDEAGEGEQKILADVRGRSGRAVVLSGDADLLVLLLTVPRGDLHLVRQSHAANRRRWWIRI